MMLIRYSRAGWFTPLSSTVPHCSDPLVKLNMFFLYKSYRFRYQPVDLHLSRTLLLYCGNTKKSQKNSRNVWELARPTLKVLIANGMPN